MPRSEYTANIALSNQPKPVTSRWEQPYIPTATRLEQRRKDLAWSNRTKNRFNRSAAFKALNSLGKLIRKGLI